MRALEQDDFELSYTSLDSYPKIIHWVLSEPLEIKQIDARISADVLQRQYSANTPYTFLPGIDIMSMSIGGSEGFDTDPYADEEEHFQEEGSFEDALDAIMDAIEDLVSKY